MITGAANGIGKGLAQRCLSEGMKVVLPDNVDERLWLLIVYYVRTVIFKSGFREKQILNKSSRKRKWIDLNSLLNLILFLEFLLIIPWALFLLMHKLGPFVAQWKGYQQKSWFYFQPLESVFDNLLVYYPLILIVSFMFSKKIEKKQYKILIALFPVIGPLFIFILLLIHAFFVEVIL